MRHTDPKPTILISTFLLMACGGTGTSTPIVTTNGSTPPGSGDAGGIDASAFTDGGTSLGTDGGAPVSASDAAACVPSEMQGPVDLTHLRFGDSQILRADKGQMQPAVGSLWLCSVPAAGRGAASASAWTNADGTWDFTRKPTVNGSVLWASQFQAILDGNGNRLVTGNAIPRTPTGVFPIDPTSVAYQYDRNPSHIDSHTVNLTFAATPKVNSTPTCVPYGATGISLTGAAIYHGASTLATDAAGYEMLDSCGGQSDGTYTYHQHYLTPCLQNALDSCTPGHSALMGYMMDGFGIYGPRGEDGTVLTSAALDECHGHTHPVEWDGETVNVYHYHWTYDFPYNVGCFRGTPVKPWN